MATREEIIYEINTCSKWVKYHKDRLEDYEQRLCEHEKQLSEIRIGDMFLGQCDGRRRLVVGELYDNRALPCYTIVYDDGDKNNLSMTYVCASVQSGSWIRIRNVFDN